MSFFKRSVAQSLKNLSGDDLLAALGRAKRRSFFGALVPSLAFVAAGVVLGIAAVAVVATKVLGQSPELRPPT